jgi:NADPH:quinone reductase-like Zn-dependent oxidoreductase
MSIPDRQRVLQQAVTAWSALVEANIGEGDVVVTQGTGGVSLFAVQLARTLGATVILTSSSDDKLKVGSDVGATHLINYRTTPQWDAEVKRLTAGRGADLVVELGGPATLAQSVHSARVGGTVAVIGVLQRIRHGTHLGRRGDAQQSAHHRDHRRQCARPS